MIDRRNFAAALGFAFVAAWIGFSFGAAVLCLLGAIVAWIAVAVFEGRLDLGELQGRVAGRAEPAPPRSARPGASEHPRVQ